MEKFEKQTLENFDDELAIQELLQDGVLFCNSRKYVVNDWEDEAKHEISKVRTLVLFVIANDVFAWGCSDAEDVDTKELPSLYFANRNHGWNGVLKWLCLKRNEQPQWPIKKRLMEDNFWDLELDSLPLNRYDEFCKSKEEYKCVFQ